MFLRDILFSDALDKRLWVRRILALVLFPCLILPCALLLTTGTVVIDMLHTKKLLRPLRHYKLALVGLVTCFVIIWER